LYTREVKTNNKQQQQQQQQQPRCHSDVIIL